MKRLLTAIKTTLQGTIPEVKPRDVFITEDIHLIRNAGSYPAIALKDGGQSFRPLLGDQEDEELMVTIAVFVQLLKPESGIMGEAGRPGVLDLTDKIVASLRDESFAGMMSQAFPLSAGPSELLATENLALIMVPVTMRYER